MIVVAYRMGWRKDVSMVMDVALGLLFKYPIAIELALGGSTIGTAAEMGATLDDHEDGSLRSCALVREKPRTKTKDS